MATKKQTGFEKIINELFGYSQHDEFDTFMSYEDDVLNALFLAYSGGWDDSGLEAW
mgnify:CR=1 FL=1